jgi:hypothetical protein
VTGGDKGGMSGGTARRILDGSMGVPVEDLMKRHCRVHSVD